MMTWRVRLVGMGCALLSFAVDTHATPTLLDFLKGMVPSSDSAPPAREDERASQDGRRLRIEAQSCEGRDEEREICPGLELCETCVPIDCAFAEWGAWYSDIAGGECSGLLFRRREIRVHSNECGSPCTGPKIESKEKVLPQCRPTDCAFAAWSEWSQCASMYDQATRTRIVERQPSQIGQACEGGTKETRACGVIPQPVDCQFAPWREWTDCSATCGEGRHTRMRSIEVEAAHNGEACEDVVMETKTCVVHECTKRACQMSRWSEWSICDDQTFQRFRHRRILAAPLNGGFPCPNEMMETEGCLKPLPVDTKVSQWSEWTDCDKTCMGGQKFRIRELVHPNKYGGKNSLYDLKMAASCNTGPCSTAEPDDCSFSLWSSWSECSTRCGTGSKTRTRSVKAPASQDGKGCQGALKEVLPCTVNDCEVLDCRWGDWDDWSACSMSCDAGVKHRGRIVEKHPKNGGRACEPEDKEQAAPCNTQACDKGCVDGQWGEWLEWSSCSATCSSGFKSRRRDIEVQPNSCGEPVSGLREQYVTCSDLPPCVEDKDCELSSWGQWNECSKSCFGVRERRRFVTVFASGQGKPCVDALKVVEPCNPGVDDETLEGCAQRPPKDCVVGEWSSWSTCTAQCGGGHVERVRKVQEPPENGGAPCDASLRVVAPCNTQPCAGIVCKDCRWGHWSEWGACSAGQRERRREIEALPNSCGEPCEMRSST
jgi:hypothetical protein